MLHSIKPVKVALFSTLVRVWRSDDVDLDEHQIHLDLALTSPSVYLQPVKGWTIIAVQVVLILAIELQHLVTVNQRMSKTRHMAIKNPSVTLNEITGLTRSLEAVGG